MRLAYGVGFLICASLLGYAYYVQHQLFLDPCPLCIVQRVAFLGMGLFFLIGALHGPDGWGRRVYALLVTAFGMFGLSVAGRHIYLQNLPADEVPACGPGLNYMLDTLPFQEVLRKVFYGSGECAEVDWVFLGLSMPWWTAIWFVALTVLALAFGWKVTRRRLFH